MSRRSLRWITAASLSAILAAANAAEYRAQANGTYRNEVSMHVTDGYRFITSNGIPDHATGRFPNAH